MNELLKALLKALGLTETVTVQDATAAVTALLSKASTVDTLTAEKAALKAKADQADTLTTELAALKAAKPGEVDPTKYVTLDRFNELNQQLAALSAKQTGDEVEALLKQAQDDGKVHGVAVDVWRDVGKSDIAKLRSLVEKTPVNPVLAGQRQTDATTVPTDVAALSAGQKEICQRMGLKEEDFLATLKANAA